MPKFIHYTFAMSRGDVDIVGSQELEGLSLTAKGIAKKLSAQCLSDEIQHHSGVIGVVEGDECLHLIVPSGVVYAAGKNIFSVAQEVWCS